MTLFLEAACIRWGLMSIYSVFLGIHDDIHKERMAEQREFCQAYKTLSIKAEEYRGDVPMYLFFWTLS